MGSVAPSVLVVEDNIDTADSLARFLRVAAGFEVRVAYDGASGVRMAVADPPDAVVCDLSLPRLHGLAVAERLTDRYSRHPCSSRSLRLAASTRKGWRGRPGSTTFSASRPIRSRSSD